MPPTSIRSRCEPLSLSTNLSSSSIVGVLGDFGVMLLSSPEALALPTLNFFFGGKGALRRRPTVESDASLRLPADVADEAERGRDG